ncbi:MAG: GNAT family N-acetyltransferase [Flavobacteriaceae bacterium]|nr:GNAT family N-acetyltransferase [Flavobacteriaceae bacterium]
MDYTIRKAKPNDMSKVLDLIKELALFEREVNAVEVSVEQLEKDGFGAAPKFTCFVGEINGTIEGMALVYYRYSTWKGHVLHLEDLIVSEAKRGSGLGTKLLDQVVVFAHDMGVKRISWEVLDWNKDAIRFYENKGAKVMRDWDVVQLNETGIKNYLSKL